MSETGCGCYVETEKESCCDLVNTKIVYCPKHQACDRLLEAAKTARKWIEGELSAKDSPAWRFLDHAITAAEGKPA